MNLVLNILCIYIIIKPVFDPMRSMTMVFPLKCILYVIATDPGAIMIIQGVRFSFRKPSSFQSMSSRVESHLQITGKSHKHNGRSLFG
jgi:hypothetical protein